MRAQFTRNTVRTLVLLAGVVTGFVWLLSRRSASHDELNDPDRSDEPYEMMGI